MTETTSGSFADLFGSAAPRVKEGELVRGRVIAIDDEHVTVDIGFKSEGLVQAWEFMDDDGTMLIKVGDDDRRAARVAENDTGLVVLSKEKADKMRIWDEISGA